MFRMQFATLLTSVAVLTVAVPAWAASGGCEAAGSELVPLAALVALVAALGKKSSSRL